MSDGGAICWPEQFPGEYKMAQKIWNEANKKYPDRKRSCGFDCQDSMYPCRHCPQCGLFVSKIFMYGSEIGGMLAVLGNCKTHGEVCLDRHNWMLEFFEGEENE